jgi:hypothetical protein
VSEREPEEKTCYDMLSGSRPGNRMRQRDAAAVAPQLYGASGNVPFEPELTSARC